MTVQKHLSYSAMVTMPVDITFYDPVNDEETLTYQVIRQNRRIDRLHGSSSCGNQTTLWQCQHS